MDISFLLKLKLISTFNSEETAVVTTLSLFVPTLEATTIAIVPFTTTTLRDNDFSKEDLIKKPSTVLVLVNNVVGCW